MLRCKSKNPIYTNKGSFTIEAVIIFWVIFSVILFSLNMLSWQFQKQQVSALLSSKLMMDEANLIKKLNVKAKVKTSLPYFISDGENEIVIERMSKDYDIHARLAWLSFLDRNIKRVMDHE